MQYIFKHIALMMMTKLDVVTLVLSIYHALKGVITQQQYKVWCEMIWQKNWIDFPLFLFAKCNSNILAHVFWTVQLRERASSCCGCYGCCCCKKVVPFLSHCYFVHVHVHSVDTHALHTRAQICNATQWRTAVTAVVAKKWEQLSKG